MRIGYIILAHQDPDIVARLARLLVEDGGLVAIHYDVNAGPAAYARLQNVLSALGDSVVWPERVRVARGEWSIVEATLNALDAIAASSARVDYVHLMSGTDFPIRPLSDFRAHLATVGGDFIECADMATERWVRDGLTHERYRYRHLINWRTAPRVFDALWHAQRRLGLTRGFPKDIRPYLGSQWWTLTWETCRRVIAAGQRAGLRRFFRTVWIPDEMFIQSVVGSAIPEAKRHRHCLTLFQFTDRGKPVVFANDHADYLARQPFFFARKISRHAHALRDALEQVARGEHARSPIEPQTVGRKSDEYEQKRLANGRPLPGRRIMGLDADTWRGDLAWNARPFVVALGASHDELKLIQQVLAASGAISCHGALFDPARIPFAGQARRFAGYGRGDVKLRDHRRTTFLSDVIGATAPRIAGLLMPWRLDEGMRDVVLWSRQACVLVVRGNVFRAYLEHREMDLRLTAAKRAEGGAATPALAADGGWTPPSEFDAFYKAYEDYHRHVADVAQNSGVVCQEIDLLRPGWLNRLRFFLECAVPPVCQEPGAVPISPVTTEWIDRMAMQLPDPAMSISNIRGLMELRLKPERRDLHREILLSSRRVAPPERESDGRLMREPAGGSESQSARMG